MAPDQIPQGQHPQSYADVLTRLGGWFFRHRTMTPVPFFLALLIVRAGQAQPSLALTIAGIGVVVLGEAMRLWGVHHIGVISRTRSDRLGPLVASGPFALVRNPLYLGNIALWVGFALIARLVWLAPAIAIVLALEYHAIVRWEERLLDQRLGDRYRAYVASVPRWIPRFSATRSALAGSSHRWRDTLFSERGTLIAIAAGYALLWIKARV